MKPNREDVVKAALTIERWCAEHFEPWLNCDCPFSPFCPVSGSGNVTPSEWGLENYLPEKGPKKANKKR